MSIDTHQQAEAKPPQKRSTRRRNVVALVGGFALVVVAIAFAATANNDEGILLTGAETDPVAREAFVAVQDAYKAFNSGDNAWVEIRDRGSAYNSVNEQEAAEEHLLELFAATYAADARLDVASCESYGFATWADIADDGPVDGYKFTCNAVRTDSLHSKAGMQLDETFVWVVSDEEVIAVTSASDIDPWIGYTQEFARWLFTAQREVAAELEFVEWQGFRVFPTPQSLQTVLEYVDEYEAAR